MTPTNPPRAGSAAWRPIAILGVALAALLVAWAAAVWMVGVSPSPAATSAALTASAGPGVADVPSASLLVTSGPSPGGLPAPVWSVHDFPGGPILAATATESGWIALGVGEAWFSADGIDWEQGTLGELIEPSGEEGQALLRFADVAQFGNGWIAVGVWAGSADSMEAAVFTSENGRDWTQESAAGLRAFPTGLASTPRGLIATSHGFAAGSGSVSESADGVTWSEHLAPGGPAGMLDVISTATGTVAVGYRYTDDEQEVPVVWMAPDGSSWTESAGIDAPPRTTPWTVGATAGGALAILATTAAVVEAPCSEASPCPDSVLEAWHSVDAGETWRQSTFPGAATPNEPRWEIDLLPYGDGLAGLANTRTGPAVWISSDAMSWSAVALPPTPASALVTGSASNGGSMLVFVSTDAGQQVLRGVGEPAP